MSHADKLYIDPQHFYYEDTALVQSDTFFVVEADNKTFYFYTSQNILASYVGRQYFEYNSSNKYDTLDLINSIDIFANFYDSSGAKYMNYSYLYSKGGGGSGFSYDLSKFLGRKIQ